MPDKLILCFYNNNSQMTLKCYLSLNNLDKTDPSEMERTYNIRKSRLGFIESVDEN